MLAEVCQIRPPKSEVRQHISDAAVVSFVPMEDLGIGQKTLVPRQARTLSEVVGSYTYFADGDVLLAKITPCFENGKLGIAQNLSNGVGFGSSEYIVFRPGSLVDKEWLYYFLSREDFRRQGAERMSGAVGHKRVSKEFIETHPIPLPPLAEQRRIVAILDEAFEGIDTAVANVEKNLAKARDLFEALLNRSDGKKESLGNLVDIRTGKLDANAAVEGGEYPFFTCSKEIYAIDKFAFDCEAILLAGNNAVGDFNVKHYKGKFNAYQRTYVITANQEKRVSYQFLYFQIRRSLKAFKAQSVGAGTKFLKLDMIKNMEIVLPPVAEQARLASQMDLVLENTERLEAIYRQKLDTLAELRQTVLQKAFAGELSARSIDALQGAAE